MFHAAEDLVTPTGFVSAVKKQQRAPEDTTENTDKDCSSPQPPATSTLIKNGTV